MSKMRPVTATPKHEVLYKELADLVGRHEPEVSAMEVLAIAANLVGKLIAMQDQRLVTREMALEIVLENIEKGNRQAIEAVLKSEGRA